MLNKIKTLTELAFFLGVSKKKLISLDPETSYASFYMNKPGKAEKRLIEYPKGELATMLERLSDALQWLYLEHITPAAYGFIRKKKPCKDPRDIYTNAKRHLGKKYLINVDLDDFFHQIDQQKLQNLFSNYKLFSFDKQAEARLVSLVSYHGRLPMGSPASPALSNFATIDLDEELISWANRSQVIYTRFVDDLSFSSNMKLTQTHLAQINEILLSHRFRPDPGKIKFFDPTDVKEVTGLIIGETVTVPAEYLESFEKEIQHFREMNRMVCQYPDNKVFDWMMKMRQVFYGRLAFLKMILGNGNETYLQFKTEIDQMYHMKDEETSVSWRYAGYEYFK